MEGESCFNCEYCFDNQICNLWDDLIIGWCAYWKQRSKE